MLNYIIHGTQTYFIKECNIMDNIFEPTTLAKKRKGHIQVLLLDFEKSYDNVMWSFLHGVMSKRLDLHRTGRLQEPDYQIYERRSSI
jgi:hypothetical protein